MNSFTSSARTGDFQLNVARTSACGRAAAIPIVLVVKKNKSILENLYKWATRLHQGDRPGDRQADRPRRPAPGHRRRGRQRLGQHQRSQPTDGPDETDPSAINGLIRQAPEHVREVRLRRLHRDPVRQHLHRRRRASTADAARTSSRAASSSACPPPTQLHRPRAGLRPGGRITATHRRGRGPADRPRGRRQRGVAARQAQGRRDPRDDCRTPSQAILAFLIAAPSAALAGRSKPQLDARPRHPFHRGPAQVAEPGRGVDLERHQDRLRTARATTPGLAPRPTTLRAGPLRRRHANVVKARRRRRARPAKFRRSSEVWQSSPTWLGGLQCARGQRHVRGRT